MPRPLLCTRLLVVLVGAYGVGILSAQAPRPAPPTPARPAATAPARTERAVPFSPGEVLSYDISWGNYLTAGTCTVTVREKKAARSSVAYHIVAEGQPTTLVRSLYPLYYKAETLLDAYLLLPHEGTIFSQEGGTRRTKITRFDQGARRGTYEVHGPTIERQTLRLPGGTQDALSALFFIRTMTMKPGISVVTPVSDSGDTFDVRVTVGAREQVRSGIGNLQAWKIEPVILDDAGRPASRHLAVWIGDDRRRLPVKLQAELAVGTFDIVLRDAR